MSNSQLGQLKAALQSYSGSTQKQAASLQQTARGVDNASNQILQIIGGSSQGKDREVANAVQEASKRVKEASEALNRAAKIATTYASSL